MIPDADIDPGSPVSSHMLKKLRDGWREDLCAPPSYTSLALRDLIYQMEYMAYTFVQTNTVSDPPIAVTLGGAQELANVFMESEFSYSEGGPTKRVIVSCSVRATSSSLRLIRSHQPYTSGSGSFSGLIASAEWVDIDVDGAWHDYLVYAVSGFTTTFSVRATLSGARVYVEAKCIKVGGAAYTQVIIQSEIYNPVNLSADA